MGDAVDLAPFAAWPRERPPLSEAHEAIFAEEYRRNRTGGDAASSVAQRLERWMHRAVAGGRGVLLELGAGTLNHLEWEPEVEAYDVVEPFEELLAAGRGRERVRHAWRDLSEVPASYRCDRVVSVAVLEHLLDLPLELARAALLLRAGGELRAGIPSEGEALWGLAWRLSTGVAYRLRTGLDYGTVMRHEHVNTAAEILEVLRALFEEVEVRRFPTPLAALSVYTSVSARRPRYEVAAAVLAARATG